MNEEIPKLPIVKIINIKGDEIIDQMIQCGLLSIDFSYQPMRRRYRSEEAKALLKDANGDEIRYGIYYGIHTKEEDCRIVISKHKEEKKSILEKIFGEFSKTFKRKIWKRKKRIRIKNSPR